jgi:hypothetical protein
MILVMQHSRQQELPQVLDNSFTAGVLTNRTLGLRLQSAA